MIHQSIASAVYKGFSRQMDSQAWVELSLDIYSLPRKRAAWMRGAIRAIGSQSEIAPTLVQQSGAGRSAIAQVLGFSFEPVGPRESVWAGFAIHLRARDYAFDVDDLACVATHHVIQRMMSRGGHADPRKAIKALGPALHTSICLWPPGPDESVLLPAAGGGVIAVRHEDYPSMWALITYIDDAKLSRRQVVEIRRRKREAAETVRRLRMPRPDVKLSPYSMSPSGFE